MAWREHMGPATFRGVPFHVDVSERAGGRRTVTHEYPLRDEPFVEDMGRAPRSFPVDGHVVGGDYLTSRDNLIAALEQPGPGELIHPYYGTLRVICTEFRVRESSADGGMARFHIEFDQTESKPAFPTATPAGADQAVASADVAEAAVEADFIATYSPGAFASRYVTMASDAAASLRKMLLPLRLETQQLADLRRRIDHLADQASTLVSMPTNLIGAVRGVFDAIGDLPPEGAVQSLLAMAGFATSISRPPDTTATRKQDRANYDALLWVIRTLAAIEAGRVATSETYDSYDAAVATRDAVCDALNGQMDGAGDASFAALEQLRADLVRAVPGEESDLPRLMRYTPANTVPSLVLTHQLYGDLSREADILARNQVPHPGFVRGGTELEVLSRAS